MDKKKFLKNYLSHLKILRPFKFVVVVSVFLSVLIAVVGLIGPYLSKIFIDVAIPEKNIALVYKLSFLLILAQLFSSSLTQINARIKIKLIQEVGFRLKNMLYQHFFNLQYSFYDSHKIGDMMHRLTNDINMVRDIIVIPLPDLIFAILKLVFLLSICLYLNWRVTLLSSIVFPVLYVNNKYFAKRIQEKSRNVQAASVGITNSIQESVSGIEVIKLFSVEHSILENLMALVRHSIKLIIDREFFRMIGIYSREIFLAFWGGFMAIYIGTQIINGHLSFGDTVALGVYISQLNAPINVIFNTVTMFFQNFIALERVNDVLEYPLEPTGGLKSPISGTIKFDNVSFAYPLANSPVINDVSFTIKENSIVGLIGPNGSGKTTLTKLLCRLYEPDEGTISINNQDISNFDIKLYKNQIGIVPQEPILFNMTVRENILFGSGGQNYDLDELCQKLNVTHVLAQLADGLDTFVGDRGQKVSKGQKQIIAILRAVIQKPKLLILDEAFNFLDFRVKANILENIISILPNSTIITITHEKELLSKVDFIIKLDYGKFEIIERREYTTLFGD